MNIDIDRLVQFYHVAEARSLARGARKLGLKAGSLSRHLKQLEGQLGFALFERDGRFATLTPEGTEFFEVSRKLAEAATLVQSVSRSLSESRRETLLLGTSDTTFWIPSRERLISKVAQDYPEITIDTVVRNSTGLIEALEEREVDISIVGICRDMGRFDYVTLHRSKPLLLIPPGHKLADKAKLRMDDVRDLDIAIPIVDNDYAFEMIYAPFLHAGAIPHWISEGPLATIHKALAQRICMIGWGFEHHVNKVLLCRKIEDCEAEIQVVAAKNIDDNRKAVKKFWTAAQEIAAVQTINEKAAKAQPCVTT